MTIKTLEILHIINDYSGTTVHKNLISALDKENVTQKIYTPIRSKTLFDKNHVALDTVNSEIIYSHVLNTYTRINYKAKIKKLVADIEDKIDIRNIDLLHAHTWYSDGGAAYELYKKYRIPYIVAVRNTDLNLFFRFMLHLRQYGKQILKNAKHIIFLSPVYLSRLLEHHFYKSLKIELRNKSVLIPNGVDSFWVNKVKDRKENIQKVTQLLYIGNFNNGKNVLRLLKAVESLNKNNIMCHLHLVGGGGNRDQIIRDFIRKKNFYTLHGQVPSRPDLEKIFSICDIFTMPSHHETFGLVYIEALSQGIPILYTQNEGIYGYYDFSIGEAVNSKDTNQIIKGIERIIDNYSAYNFNPREIVKNHDWAEISKLYKALYDKTVIKH